MKILDLPLKAEWFDMIESGVKTEEYREIKPYWIGRFIVDKLNEKSVTNCGIKYYGNKDIKRNYYICRGYYGDKTRSNVVKLMLDSTSKYNNYTYVRFRYGYTNRTMLFKLDNISIGLGKSKWGAPEWEVFILKLGERIE